MPSLSQLYQAIITVSIILALILFYFIVSLVRQHRRSLAFYRRSLYAEITTLEKERARMAADLHDEIGPVLSALKMRINSFTLGADDTTSLIKTNQHIDALMQRLREISFDLMPKSLHRKGLASAAREFIAFIQPAEGISIVFRGEDLSMSEVQSINLYRIIQELIHNALRHSDATEVLLELSGTAENILLVYSDNSKGFEFEKALKESGGMGLHNLMSRTDMLEGKLFYESMEGSRFTFEIPRKPSFRS